MKRMKIFEPAICCPTGICGVGVDSELLHISAVLDALKKHGADVDRFNPNNAPAGFITDQTINAYIKGPFKSLSLFACVKKDRPSGLKRMERKYD